MKPPWRFIADLVSGRKSSEIDDASLKGGSDRLVEMKALPAPVIEHKPMEAAVVTSPEVVADEATSNPEEVISASVSVETDDAPVPAAELNQSVANPDVLAVIATPPRPRRIRASKSIEVEAVPVVDETPVSSAANGQAAVDEASLLDQEIRELRSQLAQKLRLQNAQLKQMLERFDRS